MENPGISDKRRFTFSANGRRSITDTIQGDGPFISGIKFADKPEIITQLPHNDINEDDCTQEAKGSIFDCDDFV